MSEKNKKIKGIENCMELENMVCSRGNAGYQVFSPLL